MNERGWVKLARSAASDPLLNKDPEYLALWVHLLCNAAYEPTSALLGGKMIILQPGQLTTGRKQLAVNSRISESKVERVLKAFETAHLIEQQKTNKNRLISILSWDETQGTEQQNGQQMNIQRTTSEQQANTLKEVKNVRNQEVRADKPPRSRFAPPTVDEVRGYCSEKGLHFDPQLFVDFYSANGWVQGKGKPLKDWRAAARLWETREKSNAGKVVDGCADEKILF